MNTSSRRVHNRYLISYNLTCAVLWTAVLGRVILLVPLVGFENVYGGVGEYVKGTQTLALLEIGHSALGMNMLSALLAYDLLVSCASIDWKYVLGLVRSPLLTTILQVSSRLLLVWFVVDRYPSATASSPFYSFMLLAWSVTEVIRYSYFVWNLQGNGVPGWVTWLRYNTFYVLYPVGISSECILVWKASTVAEWPFQWVFRGLLGVYVPGQ